MVDTTNSHSNDGGSSDSLDETRPVIRRAGVWIAGCIALVVAGPLVAVLSPNGGGQPPTLAGCRQPATSATRLSWCAHAVFDDAGRDLRTALARRDFAAIRTDFLTRSSAVPLAAGKTSDPGTIARELAADPEAPSPTPGSRVESVHRIRPGTHCRRPRLGRAV